MKKLLLLVGLFAIVAGAYAQTGTVRGTIREQSGAVPGATIRVEGTTLGGVTNIEGQFTIANVPAGKQTLIISYVGFALVKESIQVEAGVITTVPAIALKEAATNLAEITVVGSMANTEAKAVNLRRTAPTIMDVIAADGIGKLPDRNAAEAVQRVSGVSIERDQGEGRFVAVRGLPSQWSSSTINGNRIPTAEEETTSRATAFDFFPSDMIQYVQVSKAVTPDMEGDAMGGNVNFITRTAPEKRTLSVALGGGLNQKAGAGVFSGNILYGDRSANDKFGFLVNATMWSRDWATDNVEPRRGNDGIGIYRLELRDYTGNRTTLGFNGAAEYKFSPNHRIFAKGLYGTLRDNELHYKHRLRFDKDRVELQNIHDILITRMQGGELGGEHAWGNVQLDWNLSSYDNQFSYGPVPNATDNGYYLTRFSQRNVGFEGLEDRGTGKNYAYNTIDGGNDDWDNISTHLPSDFVLEPSQMGFDYVEIYKVYVNERDRLVGQANLSWDVSPAFTLKGGLKYRNKVRNAVFSDEFYNWNGSAAAPTLADMEVAEQPGGSNYLAEIGSPYSGLFVGVQEVNNLDAFWDANRSNLILDEGESVLLSNGGSLGRTFDLFEQHNTGYLMGTYTPGERLSVMAGLRATQTNLRVEGYTYLADTDALEDNVTENNYLSLLPNLQVRFSPTTMTNIRGAFTRTFARPDFGSLSPGGTFIEVDNQYKAGNPSLAPTYSWNYDLTVDHFFGNLGFVSAGVFYKAITDPIFQTNTLGTFNGREGVNFIRPENGDNAWLGGAELAVNKKFDFLPGLLGGFGINANYTYMQSAMEIPGRTEAVRIPRQADHLFNVALFYDNAKLSARLALNYKGDYVMEHGSEPMFDTYYGAYTSMDFSATYRISERVSLYAEANNLLNNPMRYYLGDPERPLQTEYYGLRGQMGLKLNLFD